MKSLDQIWQQMQSQKAAEEQQRLNRERTIWEQKEIARQEYLKNMKMYEKISPNTRTNPSSTGGSNRNIINPDAPGLFDIQAQWELTLDINGDPYPVSDEATFRQWLTNGQDGLGNINSFTDIIIEDFSITDVLPFKRITCKLKATATQYLTYDPSFSLSSLNMYSVYGLGNIKTNELDTFYVRLGPNKIEIFEPEYPLSEGITMLDLDGNLLESFDPSLPLPNSLSEIYLSENPIESYQPTRSLPDNLEILGMSSCGMTLFEPQISLPTSLIEIYLDDNLISDYGPLETWAGIQEEFTNGCLIILTGNPGDPSGTGFETAITAKNATIVY